MIPALFAPMIDRSINGLVEIKLNIFEKAHLALGNN